MNLVTLKAGAKQELLSNKQGIYKNREVLLKGKAQYSRPPCTN
jgi:hypothetical protein